MRQTFRLQNLDCANCAAKMEAAIGRLNGVNSVSVSFLTQKLTLDADDAAFDAVLQQAARVCKKIEPDCTILL